MKTIPTALPWAPEVAVLVGFLGRCRRRAVFGRIAPLLLLVACGRPAASPPATTAPAGSSLRVLTSVLPVGLFTRAVAGDCARVESLLPVGADLHDPQVSPRQLARLRDADVLVLNGLGLEASLERLLAAAGSTRLRRIETAAAVTPLPPGADRHHGNHSHGDHSHGDHSHGDHSHGAGSGAVNPHVWLDPRRAAAQVRSIRDGLVAADPARAACFQANAAAFLAELERLDAELARQLAPHAGGRIVSHHDLAPYFADRYRLRADSVVDLPGRNPSAADLQRVVGVVRRSGVRALLVEPQGAAPSFRALAADLKLPLLPFDPIETASPADSERPAHYLEAMRRNAASVLSSFTAGKRGPG